jgi:hypothetical protein
MKKITFFLLAFLGITLYSFGQVSLCEDAVSVSLPYTNTDNTANYADTNYEGSPGATGCGTTSPYLAGNNVVYAYTATSDTSIKINLTSTDTWKGMFVYTDCTNIGSACAAGVVTTGSGPLNIESLAVTNGQTYYIVLGTWPAPQTMTYTISITENTCTNPTTTYAIVSNCDSAAEFFVDVDITNLGSATSVTVSDNQGSATQNVSVAGIVQFGPYPNATSVIFTVTNDQDPNCVVTSTSQTQEVCPPSNDLCSSAIDLSLETSPLSSTTVGATNSNTPTCGGASPSPDVYYSILIPNGSTFTIQQTINSYDSVVSMFYGDCDNPTAITCYDDPDTTTTVWVNTTGSDQNVYFVVDGWGSAGQSGTFTLAWSVIACSNATASYTVVSDCDTAAQFFVDVNITNLGSATSLTISDNQASATQTVTTTGTVQFGPYPNATSVIFTVANDQDALCTITSAAQTQAVCPPDCDNAVEIAACGEVVTAAIPAGPGSWNVNTCGFNTPGIELVYSFTPIVTGPYVLEVTAATGGYVDYYYKEANGFCNNNGWTCIDDNFGAGIDPIGTLTAGTEYLFLVDSEGTSARTHTFRIQCLPTCTNATATYALVSDCNNAPQFFVDVNITDLGTATSLTISDNQANANQTVTAIGTVQFGPYPNATSVIITVANDQDATCIVTSTAQTQAICPPDCATSPVIECYTDIVADFVEGPGSWNVNSCGFSTPGVEKVYRFTAPSDGTYSLEVTSATGGYVDYYYKVANGSCNNTGWTCIDDIFSAGTAIIGTLTSGTEYLILLDSEGTSARNQIFKIVCPPSNDLCINATPMTITADFDSSAIVVSNIGATSSPTDPSTTCSPAGRDVWYESVATSSGNVVVETRSNGSLTDTVVSVYTGTCDNLVLAGCSDNEGIDSFSLLTFSGLTPGVSLFLRVWSKNNTQGTFLLGCADASLSLSTFDNANFTYRPNPVVDILNLEYNKPITSLSVYNLVGQQVIIKTVNAKMSQIDMSALPSGTYMVKVTSNNEVKTIKVVKE